MEYIVLEIESEKKLVEIWEGVFGVKVGVIDNFFMIGGYFLKVMMMMVKI